VLGQSDLGIARLVVRHGGIQHQQCAYHAAMADDCAVLADGVEPALNAVAQPGLALTLGPNLALSCRAKERQWYFCSLNFTKAAV